MGLNVGTGWVLGVWVVFIQKIALGGTWEGSQNDVCELGEKGLPTGIEYYTPRICNTNTTCHRPCDFPDRESTYRD